MEKTFGQAIRESRRIQATGQQEARPNPVVDLLESVAKDLDGIFISEDSYGSDKATQGIKLAQGKIIALATLVKHGI